MKIAVTYENGNIFQHFGNTETFMVYSVSDGKIIEKTLLHSGDSGHGALAKLLQVAGVNVLICGGIGGGAQIALTEAGIRFYGGASGNADSAVTAFLAGSLNYDPDAKCDHNDHQDGEHSCGEHSCGEHHACHGHADECGKAH